MDGAHQCKSQEKTLFDVHMSEIKAGYKIELVILKHSSTL